MVTQFLGGGDKLEKMRQRRFNLKAPRNEMPPPGDPRLKAYERQKEIDKEAMRLFGQGYTWAEAYHMAMESKPLVQHATAAGENLREEVAG